MVKERMDLLELMRKRGVDGDVRVLVEEIMEADVSLRTGAGYGERNPERVTQRNGYRSRAWDTRVGTMELQIPKLREGSYSWQRCRTHFMTNLLTQVPRSAQPWVATMVRTIYQQPSPQEVHAQLERVIAQLQDPFPQVASRLDEAGPDILGLLQSSLPSTGGRSGLTTLWRVSTRRSDAAPMWWASSLTGQPCVAWSAPSWLSSTTNGPSAVDISPPPF